MGCYYTTASSSSSSSSTSTSSILVVVILLQVFVVCISDLILPFRQTHFSREKASILHSNFHNSPS